MAVDTGHVLTALGFLFGAFCWFYKVWTDKATLRCKCSFEGKRHAKLIFYNKGRKPVTDAQSKGGILVGVQGWELMGSARVISCEDLLPLAISEPEVFEYQSKQAISFPLLNPGERFEIEIKSDVEIRRISVRSLYEGVAFQKAWQASIDSSLAIIAIIASGLLIWLKYAPPFQVVSGAILGLFAANWLFDKLIARALDNNSDVVFRRGP